MNKEELKKLIADLTKDMESEQDPTIKSQKAQQLQKAVETYVGMIVPQNRMMDSGGSNE